MNNSFYTFNIVGLPVNQTAAVECYNPEYHCQSTLCPINNGSAVVRCLEGFQVYAVPVPVQKKDCFCKNSHTDMSTWKRIDNCLFSLEGPNKAPTYTCHYE